MKEGIEVQFNEQGIGKGASEQSFINLRRKKGPYENQFDKQFLNQPNK